VTPERFRQIRDLADAALDRPQVERAAFLAESCSGDDALRAEVDSLLAAYEDVRSDGFLETPAAELPGSAAAAQEDAPAEGPLPAGTRLGPYEVRDAVGRGGMGIVYRAVRADDEYRQVVAVKVILRGMDTAVGQRRFREERQILAGLDHPGIARLLDGGTTQDGLPYFVMEYVEGEPIDSYCDHRRLGVVDRLRLFLGVCAAVHHAHRSLVVHRDLKPGNVLVTPEGVPKLLDFGIARLVRPAGDPGAVDPTVTLLRMLTPDYASPEQVRGQAVTTATDVYSLGVLLYELLSGHRPYKTGLVHEVLAAICDQDPERPSVSVSRTQRRGTGEGTVEVTAEAVSGARGGMTPGLLRKKLSGDLDTIVLKALRKVPTERYASVEAFADDVRRHLEGRPVQARPQTLAYRAGKFVRRNPAAAAAATLAVTALLGGIAATTRQARRADQERALAERRFEDVRKLAGAFLFDFHDSIANLPGSTVARELVVTRALLYLDQLAAESRGNAALQRELAAGYQRLGDVQGAPGAASLGDTKGAQASYEKALVLRQELAAAQAAEPQDVADLALVEMKLSRALVFTGDLPRAVDLVRGAAARLERLPGKAKDWRDREAAILHTLGYLLGMQGAADEALSALQRAEEAGRGYADVHPNEPEARTSLAFIQNDLASRLAERHEDQRALEVAQDARAVLDRLIAADPNNTRCLYALVLVLGTAADAREALGAGEEADRDRLRAVELARELLALEPQNRGNRMGVVITQQNLGAGLIRRGKVELGLARLRDAVRGAEEAIRADPANGFARHRLACVHAEIGLALARLRQGPAEKCASLGAALSIWDALRNEGRLPGEAAATIAGVGQALKDCPGRR
jgi:non-specific serine/threonine protein kinase/serine/threonine-protein kinase